MGSGISEAAEVGNVWEGTLLHVGRQSMWNIALSPACCTSRQTEACWRGFKISNQKNGVGCLVNMPSLISPQ